MSTQLPDPARVIGASLDHDPAISAETLLKKFLVRWPVFAACLAIVPAVALFLGHQIPSSYKGTAQILIRHQGGTSGLYGEFVPHLPLLSGATAAEILRGEEVASRMITKVGVENEDIARPAAKVLFGKAASVIMPLFGREPEDHSGAGNPRYKSLVLAKEFKPSVEASTLMIDRSPSGARDELIEVVVKSFSREKVADMTNELCASFIEYYSQRTRSELALAREKIDQQIQSTENRLGQLSAGSSSGGAAGGEMRDGRPLSASLAVNVSELETRLLQLRVRFAEDSPEYRRAQEELAEARALLARQESTDAARESLNALFKKRREIDMASELYSAEQTGLSIVERAMTPRKTKLTLVMKYGIPGAAGILAGAFLGLISVLLLDLLDPRILVASDAATAAGAPLLGTLRKSDSLPLEDPKRVAELPTKTVRPALLQALGKLDVLTTEASRLIVVTTARNEAPGEAIGLQLAALMSRDQEGHVLLVDADFDRPALSQLFSKEPKAGLLDVLSGKSALGSVVQATDLPSLFILPLGTRELRDGAGSSRSGWDRFLDDAQKSYDKVVIVTGGLLNSREAAPLAKRALRPILVTGRKRSRRVDVAQASTLLREISAPALGVIHCDAAAALSLDHAT